MRGGDGLRGRLSHDVQCVESAFDDPHGEPTPIPRRRLRDPLGRIERDETRER
jgi:hypothetical protein